MSARSVRLAPSEAKTVATSTQLLPNLSGLTYDATGAVLPADFHNQGYGGTLAGLDLTYKEALARFRAGDVFRSSHANTVAIDNAMLAPLNAISGDIAQSTQVQVPHGGLNDFFPLVETDRDTLLVRMSDEDRTFFRDMAFGMRRARDSKIATHPNLVLRLGDETYASESEREFAEVWNMLQAAMAGIGPRVLAAGLLFYKDGQLAVSVLEKGTPLPRQIRLIMRESKRVQALGYDDGRFRYNNGEFMSQHLVDAFKRTGEMKLLMGDTKPGNTVVFESKCSFIDFDPRFTTYLDEQTNELCVEFLNVTLFLSAISCNREETNITAGLTSGLRRRMEDHLLPHVRRQQDGFFSMCEIMGDFKLSDANPAKPWLNEKNTLIPNVIGEMIMHRVNNYLSTFCERQLDQTSRTAAPIFYQLAERALERMRSPYDVQVPVG